MSIVTQVDDDQARESYLVVVIEPDNLERITLQTGKGFLRPIKYPDNFHTLIAYESDPASIYEMISKGTPGHEVVRHLMRGFKFKRQDGKRAELIRRNAS